MKLALFGGVFNPPHLGHVLIARQVLDFSDADELWFLPSYGQNPPKPGVAETSHRRAMVRLLSLPRARVSTIEIDHKLDGSTISLLPYLPKEHEYRFVIGSDWLPRFHEWGHWEELVKKLPFVVFPRQGYPNKPLYPNMTLLTHELLMTTDISSTKIRERVARGFSVDQFVPKDVAAYIEKHGLYT